MDRTALTVDYHSVEYKGSSIYADLYCREIAVSGEGNNFTLCFTTDGETLGSKTKMATIMSGTVTDSGISNLYFSNVMLESSKPSATMAVGAFRSWVDQDKSSPKVEWVWGN